MMNSNERPGRRTPVEQLLWLLVDRCSMFASARITRATSRTGCSGIAFCGSPVVADPRRERAAQIAHTNRLGFLAQIRNALLDSCWRTSPPHSAVRPVRQSWVWRIAVLHVDQRCCSSISVKHTRISAGSSMHDNAARKPIGSNAETARKPSFNEVDRQYTLETSG